MKKLWNLLRRLFGRKKPCQFQAVTVLATYRGRGPNVIVPIIFRRPTPEQFRDFVAKADRGDKVTRLYCGPDAIELPSRSHDKLADNPENQ